MIKWLANLPRSGYLARSVVGLGPCAYFPSSVVRLAPSLSHSRRSGSARLSRILLVEDERDVRLILEHVLIDAGYAVDTAETASGARELLDGGSYDVLLADARLPDGTGMDLCDAAAEMGVKCLVMTGYAFTLPEGIADRYDVLLKPLRPIEIITALKRVLQS